MQDFIQSVPPQVFKSIGVLSKAIEKIADAKGLATVRRELKDAMSKLSVAIVRLESDHYDRDKAQEEYLQYLAEVYTSLACTYLLDVKGNNGAIALDLLITLFRHVDKENAEYADVAIRDC